jgi:hypothetical protein
LQQKGGETMKLFFLIKGKHFFLFLVFIMMCSVCSLYAEESSIQTHSSLGLNILIEGNGVQLSRNSHTGYIPVSAGTEVKRGDLIKSEKGQAAKILCADFSLHSLPLKEESPCPCENKKSSDYKGYIVQRPMGAGSSFPYIIHPRHTAILTPKPLLRWYNTGSRSYKIELTDEEGNMIWQEKNVVQSQINYPGKLGLQAGKDYMLWVTDNDTGDNSGSDPMHDLAFQLLDNKTVKAIEVYKLKIKNLDLSKISKDFAIALYYATQRYGELKLTLSGESLALLDSISNDLPTPAVHLWRGHVYGEMLLNNEAEKAYTQALELAKATGELYMQAEANGGLWCVTNKKAYQNAAMQLYNELGESNPKYVCKNNKIHE